MFKKFITVMALLALCSCAFKSSEDGANNGASDQQTNGTVQGQTGIGQDPESDFDGDLVRDVDEIKLGRNPKIADIPEVKIRFLQNYKIIATYKELATGKVGEFVIDTKVHQDDPDFQYRVGEIFIRNESYKNAANVGKFSTHTWGEVQDHDLSWVSYPDVDSRFYSDKVLKYKRYFDPQNYEITNVAIDLENSVRLKENRGFKNIKDLVLNFHYYDYEKETFEQIQAVKVERHFNAGVNETFNVRLENVPVNIIADNYFKKGEFIISELDNFDIPEMETSYKQLLSSVKVKCIPVVFNTPLESNFNYVGTGGKEASFTSILEDLFGSKYVIEDNVLKKIGQFENNLPDFTYLSEIKTLDKKGKWFVFTNKINQHYLDHPYGPKDVISLSYITGNGLASQDAEKIFSFRDSAVSVDGAKIYPLGNVSPNSTINIQLEPKRIWGEAKKHWNDSVSSPGGSCGRNCIQREFTCWHEFNLFSPLDSEFKFSRSYDEEIERIKLVINQDEFSLKNLINEKKVIASWEGDNLHFTIADINLIKPIQEFDENVLALKLYGFKETTFSGVKLMNWSGRDWYTCIPITINVAGSQKWPLSVESKDFGNWAGQVRWDLVQRGDSKTYTRDFSVGISSVVTNHFN